MYYYAKQYINSSTHVFITMHKKDGVRMLIYSEATLPYFKGGGEVFLDKFAKFFHGRGCEIVIVSNKINKKEKVVDEVDGVKIYRIPPTIPPPSYYGWPKTIFGKIFFVVKKSIREIIKALAFTYILAKFKPDILVLNGVTVTSLPSFVPGATVLKTWRLAKKLSNIKVLLIVHAINPPKGKTLKNALADASGADAVVCVEKWMRDLLNNKIHGKKIEWIHNGVDVKHFNFKPVSRTGNILFVGRLSEDHGLDILLEALYRIRSKYPWIMARVVGEGPEKERYIKLAEKLDLTYMVDFRGGVDHEDMPEEYYWAFIVVNPVRVPAIGISTLEAMSCGRIILKSSVGGKDDVVVNDVNGFLFELGDPESLAEKLKMCLELGEEKIEAITREARETVVSRFNLNNTFARYENIIHELAS